MRWFRSPGRERVGRSARTRRCPFLESLEDRVLMSGSPPNTGVPAADFNGDAISEPAVFRPATAQWFVRDPEGDRQLTTFGGPDLNDIPVPGDYDGVGHTQVAVFRASTAQWFVHGPSGPAGSVSCRCLYGIPV